jgi:hypothetical protein
MSLRDDMRVSAGHENEAYKTLPLFIQNRYSEKEWLWLSDEEKARLVQTETEPEWTEP